MLKTIIHPVTGKHYHMGRRRSEINQPSLQFELYAKTSLPSAPPTCSYSLAAKLALVQMYLNDTLGDCVIACLGHMIGVFTANSGQPAFIFTPAQIEALYSAIGGYVPGNPATDNGCDIQTMLRYAKSNGAPNGSNQIAGSLALGTDPMVYKSALYLFENLIFGVELPDMWVNQLMPNGDGFNWPLAGPADPENGHCFLGVGYDELGVKIDTWDMIGNVTQPAIKKYVGHSEGGQLFTAISQETLNRAIGKAPNGLNWTQLVADFNALGGNLVLPVAA